MYYAKKIRFDGYPDKTYSFDTVDQRTNVLKAFGERQEASFREKFFAGNRHHTGYTPGKENAIAYAIPEHQVTENEKLNAIHNPNDISERNDQNDDA